MSSHTLASIKLSALRHNFKTLSARVPGSKMVSVVKADAYGHGIGLVTAALQDSELLAVALAGELEAVRAAGWQGRILVLEGFFDHHEYQQVQAHGAEFVVHQQAQLDFLRQYSDFQHQAAWLKINTGMNRLGFEPGEAKLAERELRKLCGGNAPVLMTHFACADEPDHALTEQQITCFDRATEGMDGPHCLANSAAILNFPDTGRDLVRPGIALYGASPVAGLTGADHGLEPVMTLSCKLLSIHDCKAGDTVGYGATFCCPQDMRIGVAGIGYGDGYPRTAGNGTPVLVNGDRANLAGRVSMDLITIDLRGHDSAREGDTVTLWGDGLPVEEVAAHADTIAYELLSGLTARVRRRAV